jgi:hypothetical protein
MNISPEENRLDCQLETLNDQVATIRTSIEALASESAATLALAEAAGCTINAREINQALNNWRERLLEYAHRRFEAIAACGRDIKVPASFSHRSGDAKEDLKQWDAYQILHKFGTFQSP